MVYLFHFNERLGHAGHYIGFTSDLPRRMSEHKRGHGTKIMRAIRRAGIGFVLARTWEGGREEERQLKARHNAPRLCPVCREAKAVAAYRNPAPPLVAPREAHLDLEPSEGAWE